MYETNLKLIKPVLILEDDIYAQTRIKKILFQLGYNYEDLFFCHNVKYAIESYKRYKQPFALIDLELPDGHGTQLIEFIKSTKSETLALVLSAWNTDETIVNALMKGADGYILKDRNDNEVTIAITNILNGGTPIDPFIARNILKKLNFDENKPQNDIQTDETKLTKREFKILELVSQGYTNKDISNTLNISRNTVETHIKHIYRKLAVCNRTKAIDTARSLGIL